MKSIQFNDFKTCAVITFLLILLIYYNVFNKVDNLSKYTNSTETRNKTIFENITTSCLNNNSGDGMRSKRLKRFLIFDGPGVIKLVVGTSFPIIMADHMRSLSYFFNFQMQYVPSPIPLFWWSFYNTSTFPARKHIHRRSTRMMIHFDKSRTLLYKFIEAFFQSSGYSGNECLLRIICEISRNPLNTDMDFNEEDTIQYSYGNNNNKIVEDNGLIIYHDLINMIFVPRYANVDERYTNARDTGTKGANCYKTFGKCQIVEHFLKYFTRFI